MPFIVMARAARSGLGPYRYLAVVELDSEWVKANPGREPGMISSRARGVRRIMRKTAAIWADGKTRRSRWVRTCEAFEALARHLNRIERAALPMARR